LSSATGSATLKSPPDQASPTSAHISGYNLSFKTTMRDDKAFMAFITSRKSMLWALLLGAAHLFFMGYSGWLNPGGWHGGLPPISLVAFVVFLIGYVINLMGRRQARQARSVHRSSLKRSGWFEGAASPALGGVARRMLVPFDVCNCTQHGPKGSPMGPSRSSPVPTEHP
jgi:hypothetical protein